MDLATIEPALAAWVATLTDLPSGLCVWENAPRPAIPASVGMLATLSWVSSPSVGVDGVTWAIDPDATSPLTENAPTVRGTRVMVLQVGVETLTQVPGKTARAVLEAMRIRLLSPSSMATLAAVNLAIGRPTAGVSKADYRVDGNWRPRSLMEVRFNATDSFTDVGLPSITSISATPTFTDPSGDTVTVETPWTAP